MPTDYAPSPGGLAWLPLLFILPCLIATLAAQKRARSTVGSAIVVERPGTWARRLLLCGPQVVVLAVVLLRDDLGQDSPAECLMLGILLAWMVPGTRDAVLGDRGVQRGWYSRRFEDLAEWRLSGDHLRFKIREEWTSVPCPPAQQPLLRERLLAVNAAGESRFQD